jgi:hypothetical protein
VGLHIKLSIVLMVAVVLSGAECLASCTVAACNSGMPARSSSELPPCHHQHQSAPSDRGSLPLHCDDLVLPGAKVSLRAQGLLNDPLIATPPISASTFARYILVYEAPDAQASPPPGLSVLSSVVLRI